LRNTLYGLGIIAYDPIAWSCTPPPPNFVLFEPNHYGVQVDDKFPSVPAVQIETVEIQRAKNTALGLCGYVSVLKVRITWPQRRAFPIEKMGFYLRPVPGIAPPQLFPREPISPVKSNRTGAELLFVWNDDPPNKQKPIAFTLEVVPIDPWLHLGPSAQKRVP
jgi:hypothetical protein